MRRNNAELTYGPAVSRFTLAQLVLGSHPMKVLSGGKNARLLSSILESPRKKILVIGDWRVDEHWLVGFHRSKTSSRVAERILEDCRIRIAQLSHSAAQD